MKALGDAAFTIVGTGLMGSSLALALRGKVKSLCGIDPDPVHLRSAAAYFDDVSTQLEQAEQADVVVLAAPIRSILQLVEKLSSVIKPGTLLVDLGSTKREIVCAMDNLPANLLAVGGHPMCGKEQSGPSAADGAIYNGCVFVICPTARSTPEALTFMHEVIHAIHARPLLMDAAQHDAAVAVISHLPYLISAALVSAVKDTSRDDGLPWKLAASGFRDTSRLAASDITMMGDILLTNREAVLDALKLFSEQLAKLQEALQASNEQALRGILDSARQTRLDWARLRSKE
jgi:prephenate dehydrogenase